ncbi:YbdK family carboxylate-amine ligase [Legionella bozemanae]|uniref:Putative glutamate--cysteine ligase 2 n=1 Tax=Legionella bozemanae TaxID=447 RepID=A0A0W0RK67_LEGBO|nr:YbdK family carboxylate-amine ligase [Legionella bozemanae]KTC71384.1 carboxylate-amine ligase [Legionella bozemanae]STO35390.1 Carboxylate-amine ligase YbdK [Legionella bozemanae]
MRNLRFKKSSVGSIGVELELQLIDPKSYSLISKAKELIRNIKTGPNQVRIKPEITQSMIEINTSIHQSPQTMSQELFELKAYLLEQASSLGIAMCGGGSHPFQSWAMQKIFPTLRYKSISRRYRFLSQMATEFGQHIHIGCGNSENALYLTHALSRYVPQLIALSASSPFYQSVNTNFCSSRSIMFNAFPLSGVIPYLINWNEFSDYFYKMRRLGIITSMKDFYWDIRPKPEFGTVEIRVFDTPLTIKKVILITAYIQALAIYLLEERPTQVSNDLYYLYNQNRFEASRYGFDGTFINPYTMKHGLIVDDIFDTAEKIKKYTSQLGNSDYVAQLLDEVTNKINDSFVLLQILKKVGSLPKVVEEQCRIWSEEMKQQEYHY